MARRTHHKDDADDVSDGADVYSDDNDIEEEAFDDASESLDEGLDDLDQIELGSGEALDVIGVDRFLLRRGVNIIAVVGDQSSGKTTLIGSLYDRFCHGPFAGYSFAQSVTLVSFDRQLFESRFASGRSQPETIRTSTSIGVHFYHLGLVDQTDGRRFDLMISDRSGEDFASLRNNSSDLHRFVEIAKANVVVVLLDGKRLVTPEDRHSALRNVQLTLRTFIDSNILGISTQVHVVLTKFDLIQRSALQEEVLEVVQEFEERLKRQFCPHVCELEFFRIAARDPESILAPAWNVDTILSRWGQAPPQPRPPDPIHRDTLRYEYDRLLWRPLSEGH